ncbi:hypothetical protein PFISCL1PPCAC_14081, partial [Pristionchus fissidentatus]
FAERAFPTLAELNEEERDILLTNYIMKFYILDSFYRTRTTWGKIGRVIMWAVTSCADMGRHDLWLGEDQGGPNRETLISSMDSLLQVQLNVVVPLMVRAQITTKEFHAAMAFLLCETDDQADVSDTTMSVLNNIRAEVYHDLTDYYNDDIGLSDFSTRLGHLLTLNYSIRVNTAFS